MRNRRPRGYSFVKIYEAQNVLFEHTVYRNIVRIL